MYRVCQSFSPPPPRLTSQPDLRISCSARPSEAIAQRLGVLGNLTENKTHNNIHRKRNLGAHALRLTPTAATAHTLTTAEQRRRYSHTPRKNANFAIVGSPAPAQGITAYGSVANRVRAKFLEDDEK